MTPGIVVKDIIQFLSKYLRAKHHQNLDTEAAIGYRSPRLVRDPAD